MPDLWDTNPRNAFSTPDEQSDLAPDDHTKEVMLKDHRGHLRPPACGSVMASIDPDRPPIVTTSSPAANQALSGWMVARATKDGCPTAALAVLVTVAVTLP